MPALEVHSGERLHREFTLEVGTRDDVVTVDVAFDLLDSGSGSIRERILQNQNLLFRAEAYNISNHPNFNIPNRTALTANFGKISSAQDSRQLQLGMKLSF
jgi:hypothetical protein